MIDPFYCAFLPDPVTVLGFRLLPLSLGHLIILHRIGSPYVVSGEPGIGDLATAVLICSLRYSEGLEAIADPKRDEFMRKWHDRLSGCDKWLVRLGFRKPAPVDFAAESKGFLDYLHIGTKIPKYSYTPSDFRDMECASVQIVKTSLMRALHFTEAELLDRSWALCLWDFITLKAIDGHVQMYSEGGKFESAVEEAMKVGQQLAEAIKQKEAQCQS